MNTSPGHTTRRHDSDDTSIWQLVFNRRVIITLVAALVFLVDVGWWSYTTINKTALENIKLWLGAELDSRLSRVEIWVELRRSVTARLALSPEVRQLLSMVRSGAKDEESARLKHYVEDELNVFQFHTFYLLTTEGQALVHQLPEFVFQRDKIAFPELLERSFQEDTVVTGPLWVKGLQGSYPMVFVIAPVLGLDTVPEGYLVTAVRLDQGLQGVITHGKEQVAVEAHVYDQGKRIVSSGFSDGSARLLPVTIALHNDGSVVRHFSLEGYEGAAGEKVVAASTWLPSYNCGLVVEVPHSRAFESLKVVRRAFITLFLLVLASAGGAMLGSFVVVVLNRRAERALRTAEKLGQYTLEARLGSGGMGEVFRGSQAMLRRPVAIKVIRPEEVRDSVIAQFEREVQNTAQLTNPNTIQIFDYGRSSRGVFFYVMEYLDGFNLKELVAADGPQSPGRVVHILTQICASLEEAHQAGLLHRDIKPANVMLCKLGGQHDVVKVLDFGLVKELDEVETTSDVQTTDQFAGTVKVVAPEVVRAPGTESVQSDIFSLGVLAYFLLTGDYLFEVKTAKEYLRCLLTETPLPPSERGGREVPEALEALIMRCLSKSPEERPSSAAALQKELLQFAGEVPWQEEQAKRWWELASFFHRDAVVQELRKGEARNLMVDTRFLE